MTCSRFIPHYIHAVLTCNFQHLNSSLLLSCSCDGNYFDLCILLVDNRFDGDGIFFIHKTDTSKKSHYPWCLINLPQHVNQEYKNLLNIFDHIILFSIVMIVIQFKPVHDHKQDCVYDTVDYIILLI